MSTKPPYPPEALYYPFHLCHARTLDALLERFPRVHFRDYMAIQLTGLSGTTAYQDRMGTYFPDLVTSGRLVQGYPVSGPLSQQTEATVDRDLRDASWRQEFHEGLITDRRFQRGLFDLSHAMMIGGAQVPGPAALLELIRPVYRERSYDVAEVRRLSRSGMALPDGYAFEYGLALVKTSAALIYTLQLASLHRLAMATDSPTHFRLLERTRVREGSAAANHLIEPQQP